MSSPEKSSRRNPPKTHSEKLLEEILAVEREQLHVLHLLARRGENRYTIRITQENVMGLETIAPGSTGQFGAVLLNNGTPDTSGFVPSFIFTTSDPSATVSPATTDASGGTIPLANQAVVSIPTGDTLGSVVVTATAVDPNGVSQSGTVTVAIGTGPAQPVFSVGVTQLA